MITDHLQPSFLAEIEEQAITWARDCGNLALESFRGTLVIEYKGVGERDPVTEADRRIEDFLRDAVSAQFPGHRVLGEERPDVGPAEADFTWVIDPIDGTVNFSNGLPLFAVSIGVLYQGVPVAGALFVSECTSGTTAIVHARRGGGSFRGDQRLTAFGAPTIHPSRPAALPAAFWRRFSFGRGLRQRQIEVRTLGSIVYELSLIAAGTLQFGAYRSPRIWDIAAGALIVSEAGGLVLYWDRQQSSWLPLQQFVAPRQGKRGEAGALRDWSMPLLVGGHLVTTFVAQHLRPREGLSARLWPYFWRLLAG